jgi:hypothetical protein
VKERRNQPIFYHHKKGKEQSQIVSASSISLWIFEMSSISPIVLSWPHLIPRELIRRAAMDVRLEAIDIYYHVEIVELRRSYLAHILQLGV